MPTNNGQTRITYTHRQEIDDLIGNPPGCLLRSGITVLALVMVTIIGLSAFIRYPDKVVAMGMMTGDYPPIVHVAKASGVIDEIYVKDGESVKRDATVAYIQNTMNRRHLGIMKDFIRRYQSGKSVSDYTNMRAPKNLQLGDLTADYARLQLLFSEFQATLMQSGVFQQISTLETEIKKTKELGYTLEMEKMFTTHELELIEKDMGRDKYLYDEGVISELEKEQSEGALLRQQKQHNNHDIGIIQNTIKEEQLRLKIQQISEGYSSELNGYHFGIEEVINKIEQQIRQWRETYYVRAEVAGKAVLQPDIRQDVFVAFGAPLLSVIPDRENSEKYAKVITPNRGIGKIATGDKAILKLDGYPYKEYGTIASEVATIAALPNQDATGKNYYEIKIPLQDTLMTNYKKAIAFRPQSTLTAEIITKDKSLLERLLEQFLSLITE